MNKPELKQVVEYLLAPSGRPATPELLQSWYDATHGLDFDTARQAAVLVLRNEAVKWVEPRHLLAAVRQVRDAQAIEARRERASQPREERQSVPMPKCVQHDKGIVFCDVCCRKAFNLNESLGGNYSHEYQRRFYEEIAVKVSA